jgi:hypothetical protein
MYRQGDVLIERVERIGEGTSTNERLLIRGEGRNHGHFITGDSVKVFKVEGDRFTTGTATLTHYIELTDTAVLEHLHTDTKSNTNEHLPITIPPGTYKVIRQREYNPYLKAIRLVKD